MKEKRWENIDLKTYIFLKLISLACLFYLNKQTSEKHSLFKSVGQYRRMIVSSCIYLLSLLVAQPPLITFIAIPFSFSIDQ